MKRLNEDYQKNLKDIEDRGFPSGIVQTNVDSVSLLLFGRILMDKIARLLHDVLRGNKIPSCNRFQDWRKKIKKFEGEGISELKKLVLKANWFEDLKNLRDDYVVHHGFSESSLGTHGNDIGIHLHSYRKRCKDVFVNVEKISELFQEIWLFMSSLNSFLCSSLDLLPIEIHQNES